MDGPFRIMERKRLHMDMLWFAHETCRCDGFGKELFHTTHEQDRVGALNSY